MTTVFAKIVYVHIIKLKNGKVQIRQNFTKNLTTQKQSSFPPVEHFPKNLFTMHIEKREKQVRQRQ